MYRLAIVGALLVATGCDDPDVETAVADILVHGVVAAHVECFATETFPVFGSRVYTYTASKLIDGSCLSSVDFDGSQASTRLVPRSVAGAGECRNDLFPSDSITLRWEAVDGFLEVSYFAERPPVAIDNAVDTVDLGASCAGFNLEAFGVE